jgi:heme exporter protein C
MPGGKHRSSSPSAGSSRINADAITDEIIGPLMKTRFTATALAAALIFYAGYAALFIAPDERTMHQLMRIFYFHLSCWTAMFCALSLAFVANIAWLATRKPKWDWLGVAGVEVGVVACTGGLVTGVLWGRPAWGIWWTWDARLTTTFILWLLYISYLLLRGLIEDPQRRATLSAVFGIFAFLDAPLVYVSNRLWRTQHPAPVILGGDNSGLDATMGKVLLLCMAAVLGVAILALIDRYRLERLRHEVDELRLSVENRSAGSNVALMPISTKDLL